MELVELKDKEFDKFAINHEYGSFLQNSYWGRIKEYNGWSHVILGIKETITPVETESKIILNFVAHVEIILYIFSASTTLYSQTLTSDLTTLTIST